MGELAERLRNYMPGWNAYFRLAQTPAVFRDLGAWIHHRLRAIQLKYWRRGPTQVDGIVQVLPSAPKLLAALATLWIAMRRRGNLLPLVAGMMVLHFAQWALQR